MNSKSSKEARLEEMHFPRLWRREISEESVFALLSYHMPLRPVLIKLMQKFIDEEKKNELLLSLHFQGRTRGVFPGYYSDKEKTLLLMNQFLDERKKWEGPLRWISYLDERREHPFVHLILGVALLDQYLLRLHQEIWLKEGLKHLKIALDYMERDESRKAIKALLSFGYYMKEEYEASAQFLGTEALKKAA